MALFQIAFLFVFSVQGLAQDNVYWRSGFETGDWDWGGTCLLPSSDGHWWWNALSAARPRPDCSGTANLIHFDNNAQPVMNLNSLDDFTAYRIWFEGSSQSRTISTDVSRSIWMKKKTGSAKIENYVAYTQTFNVDINIDTGTYMQFNPVTGNLVFNNSVYNRSLYDIMVFGENQVTFNGNISNTNGSPGLIIDGSSGNAKVVFSGVAKTYTGTTQIKSGTTLQISSNQSLGAIILESGGNLVVDAGITLTITGTWTGGGTITNNGTIVLTGPSSFPGSSTTISAMNNLTINNSSGITLDKAVSVSGILTLTNGILYTSATNLLSVTNSAVTAITGYSTASFVQGPLKRSLQGSVSTDGITYFFPVADETGNYRPFELVNIRTGAISPAVTVTVAATGATTTDNTLPLIFPRNWRTETSGDFTSATIRITESGLTSASRIGASTAQPGNYTGIGGVSISSTISSTSQAGTLPKYFAIGSSVGVFYNKSSGAGSLQTLSNWGTNTDGTGYAPSTFTAGGQTFNIYNGSTAGITAGWAISGTNSKIIVGNGTNPVTLTIPSAYAFSTSAVDISGSATLINQNSVTSFGTCTVLAGGIYQHNVDGGTIPAATWNTGSECKVTGYVSSATISGLNQSFYNFTWNNTGQNSNYILEPASMAITGLMTISNTGSGSNALVLGNSISNRTLTAGSLNMIAGNFYLTGSSASAYMTLNISSDLNITGGTFEICRSNNSNADGSICAVGGSLTISSGTLRIMSYSGSGSTNVVSSMTVSGNVTVNGGTIDVNSCTLTGNPAGRLFISGNLTISSGNLTFSQSQTNGSSGIYFNGTGSQTFTHSGGTLNTATQGIGRRFYYKTSAGPTGINENYSASSAQNTISGLEGTPATGYSAWPVSGSLINNITINNSAGVTLSTAKTINGTLTLTSGLLTTTTSNLLWVANSSNTAILNSSTTQYVNGPMKWTLTSGTAYTYPVGKGGVYYPFTITPTGTAPVIQAEAFNTTCGGTAGTGMSSISTAEYWQTSVSSGTYTNGTVGITRQTALGTLNSIGRSTTLTGAYSCLNGTASTTSVTGSDLTGNSLGYFVFGVKAITSTITTGSITGSSFCTGASGISVPFTYTPVNGFSTFTAQLSDAAGSFSSPVTLQSVASNNTGSQTVPVTIQVFQSPGTGYRIRVVSTWPTVNGSDNGSNLTINGGPAGFTVLPTTAGVCAGNIQRIVGILSNPTTILTQNFNGATNNWTKLNYSSGGDTASAAWKLRPNGYYYNGNSGNIYSNDFSQFYMSNSDAQGVFTISTSTILQSPSFTTLGYSAVNIGFYQYFETGGLAATAKVEASKDGTSWTTLQTYSLAQGDQGAHDNFLNSNVALTSTFLNQSTVYIRFKYDTPAFRFWWCIDNVTITGTPIPTTVTWTPVTYLYTNTTATVPYTAGFDSDTVYCKPYANTTYTATATTSAGCTRTGASTINANNVEVIGNTNSACYPTVKAAFDAINSGTHTGTLTVKIHGSTTETATATLNPGTSPANYTSLHLYPTSSGLSISGLLDAPLIYLNGACSVTIDGRVNGTGSTKDLTIVNTSNGSSAATIKSYNYKYDNTIEYCKIKGASTDPSGGVIYMYPDNNNVSSPNQISIHDNEISGNGTSRPVNALYFYSNPVYYNPNISIQNNSFYDFLNRTQNSGGININAITYDCNISGNSFYETGTFIPTADVEYHAVKFVQFVWNAIISGNYIGGSQPGCVGSFVKSGTANNRFTGILFDIGSEGSIATIQSNQVRKISWANSGNGSFSGIYFLEGTYTIGGDLPADGNLIGDSTGSSSITYTAGANGGYLYGIIQDDNISYSENIDIKHNKIGGITVGSTDNTFGASFYGIFLQKEDNWSVNTIRDNLIGSRTDTASIRATSTATAAGSNQKVTGIYANSDATIYFKSNYISGLVNHSTTTNSSTLSATQGIYAVATSSDDSIYNNTVSYLTNFGGVKDLEESSVVGININSRATSADIKGNVIFNLRNKNTSAATIVTGIFSTISKNSNDVQKNFIHSLYNSSSSTSSKIYGINCAGGSSNCLRWIYNNIITFKNLNSGSKINGVYVSNGSRLNVFYNTVSLVGNNSSSEEVGLTIQNAPSSSLIHSNILCNNSSGAGQHYAARAISSAGSTWNRNDYVGLVSNGASNDSSLTSDPQFVDPYGTDPIDFKPLADSLEGLWDTRTTTDFFDTLRCFPTMGAIEVKGALGSVSPVTGPDTLCAFEQGVVYQCPDVSYSTTYIWVVPPDWQIVSGQGTNKIVVNVGDECPGCKVVVTADNNCDPDGRSASLDVRVLPKPKPGPIYHN